VFARGDNHQTLRANTEGKEHEDVIWQFLSRSEELTPAEADDIIDMEVEEDVEQAVKRAAGELVRLLGLTQPSETAIEDAVAFATKHSVDAKRKRDIATKNSKKADSREPRYFGVLTEIRFPPILDQAFSSEAEADSAFYDLLQTNDRLSPRPHITIIHSKEKNEVTQDLWDRCNDLHSLPVGPLLEFDLGEVLWDGRVMAITVDGLHLSQSLEEKMADISLDSSAESKATEFMRSLPDELKSRLHITVGTKDRDVPPVEAKTLVQRWREGDRKGIYSVKLDAVKAQGRLKGLMQ
jgi:tRNA ligase